MKMNSKQLVRQNLKHYIQFIGGLNAITEPGSQVCSIERFMVRTTEAVNTHFFSAIRAFTQLELMITEELIENWYQLQRNLSLQVASTLRRKYAYHLQGL